MGLTSINAVFSGMTEPSMRRLEAFGLVFDVFD